MQFHFVTKVLLISRIVHTEVCSGKCGRLQEVKNNRKSLNRQSQKVVAVAYRRYSFTGGSNCKT